MTTLSDDGQRVQPQPVATPAERHPLADGEDRIAAAAPSIQDEPQGQPLTSLPDGNGASRQATPPPSQSASQDGDAAASEQSASDLDFRGTALLAIQHASSSWGYRSAEFAFPLYFVQLFTNTLLPASVYGFLTTAAGILLSGTAGGLVDRFSTHRLRAVRGMILAQKLSTAASYALFLLLFLDDRLTSDAENEGRGADGQGPRIAAPWLVFAAITFIGCFVILSNVGVSVAVERDWVTSISDGSSARLVRLNAIMRRIDLLSNLLSPLFVSLLTSTVGYPLSIVVLLAICGLTFVFELAFVGIVFRRFPLLGVEEARHREAKTAERPRRVSASDRKEEPPAASARRALLTALRATRAAVRQQLLDWREFALMPVFISSCSISLLYMSVLSFDATFLAYLKSATSYSDAFIAGMRSLCVVTGLVGTFVSPALSARVGLVRTGSYSLWAELLPLTPALVALWVGAGPGRYRPPWNTALLFTGLALSRVGLWSFDLAQLAQVQTALSTHPRRNSLMGLQFSLQNIFDLGHYGLTIGWSRPEQFRNAAAVSYAAVGLATLVYVLLYARRQRGHLLHLDRLGLRALLGRKRD